MPLCVVWGRHCFQVVASKRLRYPASYQITQLWWAGFDSRPLSLNLDISWKYTEAFETVPFLPTHIPVMGPGGGGKRSLRAGLFHGMTAILSKECCWVLRTCPRTQSFLWTWFCIWISAISFRVLWLKPLILPNKLENVGWIMCKITMY